MDFTKTHLVLLIVTISMLFAPTTNAAGGLVKRIRTPQARVYAMCKRTTFPSLCFRTILPKALVTPKFNKYKAFEIVIQATSVQINKTAAIIKSLMPKYAKDENHLSSLRICDDMYGFMIDSITNTIPTIARRDFIETGFQMGNADSYNSSCKGGYDEGGIVAPFIADADLIADHITICLDIMRPIMDKQRNAEIAFFKKKNAERASLVGHN